MSDVKVVTTEAIAEREVGWTPKGWRRSSRKVAIVRDGKLEQFPQMDVYYVEADPDGCIEFIQAIKRAMAETRKS